MVVTTLSTKVLRQPRFRVFVIPRGQPANRALETRRLILTELGCEEAGETRSERVDAEEAVDSVD
jgi:hypothetical protein